VENAAQMRSDLATLGAVGHSATIQTVSRLRADTRDAYGALRVACNLFPSGFHLWSKWIAVLAVVGIVYAAAVALRQSDLKFVIGYSSVSHMGFVLLGLATANALGVSGAVLQMFSHGVIGALLFALAGAVYYRTHTRDLNDLSRLNLGRTMPFLAVAFVLASAASMGIPGFSGFAAEITILLGAWKTYPLAVWITGLGMVLGQKFSRIFTGTGLHRFGLNPRGFPSLKSVHFLLNGAAFLSRAIGLGGS